MKVKLSGWAEEIPYGRKRKKKRNGTNGRRRTKEKAKHSTWGENLQSWKFLAHEKKMRFVQDSKLQGLKRCLGDSSAETFGARPTLLGGRNLFLEGMTM